MRSPESVGGSFAGAFEAVHASAVVVGEFGLLIRGAPGAGKSELAGHIIGEALQRGHFARLVGDDRIIMATAGARILLRSHPGIAGMMERRWEGIVAVPYEPAAVLRCVVDLEQSGAPLPDRIPEEAAKRLIWREISVPRLVFPASLTVERRTARVLDFLARDLAINSLNLCISPLPIG
jgi:HPr kinase/phosphorylase